MSTNQPDWKFALSIGDRDPIAYGGGFVYTDATGSYGPEMTWFEPGLDGEWQKHGENTPLQIYRILIEEKSEKEWWWQKLPDVATSTNDNVEELRKMAHGGLMEKALLYEILLHYFGAHEFDQAPVTITEKEAYAKYAEEMKAWQTSLKSST